MKTTTNIIYPAIAVFALAYFALSATAQATCQDGCLSSESTALGEDALLNGPGLSNTAIGFNALYSNTSALNTAVGWSALYSNTSGGANTATGWMALYKNDIGHNNTATGIGALEDNTSGAYNTASGGGALLTNDTGQYNTANGYRALYSNDIGNNNTATGSQALYYNTGSDNTATGFDALESNTSGHSNTAIGGSALESNTTGNSNAATGFDALLNNTTGINNTATGASALQSNTTGSNNIAVGANAGTTLTTGSNNIDIGNPGKMGEANTIRIGSGIQTKTFIAGISGAMVPGGVGVIVGPNGLLGTVVSSGRFKEAVQPMDKASEAILALKPVTFRYKKELDPEGIPQFGLVAEDVEKVNPSLVARDEQGKPYTVRYEAVNTMLLNEFLKEHRKVEQLEATVAKLQSALKDQGAQIQKVSARLETSRPAARLVDNNQ